MEIIFQSAIYVVMCAINLLVINFLTGDNAKRKDYLLAVIPFFGTFYTTQFRPSITGLLYSIFRVLEVPALSLFVLFLYSECYAAFCWVLISISFVTCVLRTIHIGKVLWESWFPLWLISFFAIIFLVESIYIFGLLPYTLQNFSI